MISSENHSRIRTQTMCDKQLHLHHVAVTGAALVGSAGRDHHQRYDHLYRRQRRGVTVLAILTTTTATRTENARALP